MDGGGAYGAGKATGVFDAISFLKKPHVILRLIALFFAIIVFGCVSDQGWNEDVCRYNADSNACGFGTTVGVIAFLALIAFLVVDFFFENLSSVQHRKYAVMADLGFSGFWSFMYFVTFCYLLDAWWKTEVDDGLGSSGVQAAIVFALFSVPAFAGLAYFAFMKFRKGVSEPFSSGFDPEVAGSNPTQPPVGVVNSGLPGNQFPSSYPAQNQFAAQGQFGNQGVNEFQQVTY